MRLVQELQRRVIGQPGAMEAIAPAIQMYQAGLNPEGRPAGVFLLLGPTGTGKTHTVEAVAEVLHGSSKQLLRIDCGEFQMDHEVARLIGAPPGYLGHRETQALLSQARVNCLTSERCGLSILLFDEIEKASPALTRLLLGVLDKGNLRLGDNNLVNFENCLIFLTSNLGARSMQKEMRDAFGFGRSDARSGQALAGRLEQVAMSAVRKQFSPEFVNRIDSVLTFHPLEPEALQEILAQQLHNFQELVCRRYGASAFFVQISESARERLIAMGTSVEYGARELKRVLHQQVVVPISGLLVRGEIPARHEIWVDWDEEEGAMDVYPMEPTGDVPDEIAA